MKVIHNTKYPSGCILDFAKKRGRFNTAESDADAGVRYVNVFGKRRMDGMRKKVDIGQSLSRSCRRSDSKVEDVEKNVWSHALLGTYIYHISPF